MIDLRASIFVLLSTACTQTNVHDTPQAKNESCVTCHSAAYQNVKDPPHVPPDFPDTCDSCHTTTGWVPAKGGHSPAIEAQFAISTGSHANPAIGCSDCHKPSLGPSAGGGNCDCIHCHLGAHTTPSIDVTHAGVANYQPSGSSAPNSCWTSGCHPGG